MKKRAIFKKLSVISKVAGCRYMLSMIITLALFMVMPAVSYSSELWAARYSGPGNGQDEAAAIAVDADGNVYVTGNSFGTYETRLDYATIKYDANGNQQWAARYNGLGNKEDVATAIAVDASGNVYVTGYSDGTGGYTYDYATVKYDANGNQQWVARYNGPGNGWEQAAAIAVDASGNVYVTGSSYGGSATGTDYATIKYDTDGNQLWIARYNGPLGNGGDYAAALAVDASGHAYVTGSSYGGSGARYDYATIMYDVSGSEQWVARYNGSTNRDDYATAIDIDVAGNVYVTGHANVSVYISDYVTIKYRTNGIRQWVARYNGPVNGDDRAFAIALDASGNVYVTGHSNGFNDTWDYATIKYSGISGAHLK